MPVRERGVRSRAGNAMGRTRAAVLDGALRAVAAEGARKTTMAEIAAAAGIAKGTLYNHFRAKEAVFAAAAEAAVQRLGDEAAKQAADAGLAAALALAARTVAESPTIARLREEPAALQPLLEIGDGAAWDAAREAAVDVLSAGGATGDRAAVDLVLRWVVSHITAPATEAIERSAALLASALTASASEPASPDDSIDLTGLA